MSLSLCFPQVAQENSAAPPLVQRRMSASVKLITVIVSYYFTFSFLFIGFPLPYRLLQLYILEPLDFPCVLRICKDPVEVSFEKPANHLSCLHEEWALLTYSRSTERET